MDLPYLALLGGVVVLYLTFAIRRKLRPPPELAHLPYISAAPILASYLSGEVDDRRIKRLYVGAGKEEGIVLSFMLGIWVIQVLDHQVC
jgi:hypothetical protein